jgi:hypothetical protein
VGGNAGRAAVTDALTPAQRESLDALRSSRGPCPPAETLVAYEALGDNDRASRPEHAHVQVCSRCQLVLLHLQEPSATGAAASDARLAAAFKRAGTWALPLAALVVLAVAVSLLNRAERMSPAATGTIRGTDLQLMAPLGAVDAVRAFSWQSPVNVDRYRVIVRRGTDVVWQTETRALSVAPPAGVFVRGVEYVWQVEAVDREGNVRLTSPPQPFTIS